MPRQQQQQLKQHQQQQQLQRQQQLLQLCISKRIFAMCALHYQMVAGAFHTADVASHENESASSG